MPQAVASVTRTGIVDADGTERAVDVIVMATGFQPANYLARIRVVGRDGRTLQEHWADEPRAYLGITVPGFPNFFMLYGPGTNGGEIVTMLEAQAEYAVRAVKRMMRERVTAIEVRAELRSPVVRVAAVEDGRHVLDDEQQLLHVADGQGGHPVALRQLDLHRAHHASSDACRRQLAAGEPTARRSDDLRCHPSYWSEESSKSSLFQGTFPFIVEHMFALADAPETALAGIARTTREIAALESERIQFAAAYERSGAWHAKYASAATAIASECNMTIGAAKALLELAETLEVLPQTADAFAAGEISRQAVNVIANAVTPERTDALAACESVLVEAAQRSLPRQLVDVVKRVTDQIDGDNGYTDDERKYRRRGIDANPTPDGMVAISGAMQQAGGEVVLTAIAAEMERELRQQRSPIACPTACRRARKHLPQLSRPRRRTHRPRHPAPRHHRARPPTARRLR